MFALPVSEIGHIFGTLLSFTLQPHVKFLPIDPYFSFNMLQIYILNKHMTNYFRKFITPSLFYLPLKIVILYISYEEPRGIIFSVPFKNPYIFATSTLSHQYVCIFLKYFM